MRTKFPVLLRQIILALFLLLFAITPLILLPWTSELFEVPKMMFVYFITVTITAAWLLYWPLTGRVPFRRTPLDIPILIFLISQILATIYSIHPYTSIWGWYTRGHGGLASTISYVVLYYAFITFMTSGVEKQKSNLAIILNALLLGSVPVAIYAVLQHWGIDAHLWVQDVRHRVFSTLGQPNWLGAYLAVILPFSYLPLLNQSLRVKSKPGLHEIKNSKLNVQNYNLKLKINKLFNWKLISYLLPITYYLLPALLYLALLYTRSRSGFLGFIVADVIFWGITFIFIKKIKLTIFKPFVICHLIFVVLSLTASTPFTPSIWDLTQKLTPSAGEVAPSSITASQDIRLIVWQGAWELGKRYPLLGTGVETFGYTYYLTRPLAHNLVSEWDFLYNKAHNEYLNFLANTGFVGLGSYLLLIGAVVWQLIKQFKFQSFDSAQDKISKFKITTKKLIVTNSQLNPYYILHTTYYILPALLAAYVSVLITNFFGFSVVVIGLYFFLLPAMAVASFEKSDDEKQKTDIEGKKQKSLLLIKTSIAVLILITAAYGYHGLWQMFKADLEYKTAQQLHLAGRSQGALQLIQQAMRREPRQALYPDLAAEISADLATMAFINQDVDTASQLTTQAISYANSAIKLNPYDLNLWKSRASFFITLSTVDPNYLQEAFQALKQAAQLAPTDPKITYNLALLYERQGQSELAIRTLRQTLEMKPNYTDALYALALFLRQQATDPQDRVLDVAKNAESIKYLETLLQYDPKNQQLKEKLEEWQHEPVIR